MVLKSCYLSYSHFGKFLLVFKEISNMNELCSALSNRSHLQLLIINELVMLIMNVE